MLHQYSNLIKNPEKYYARAIVSCKEFLINHKSEDFLALMEYSDISEITFTDFQIKIRYPTYSMEQYTIETKILIYNLKKSDDSLGYCILIEDEEGNAIDDLICIDEWAIKNIHTNRHLQSRRALEEKKKSQN